MSKGKGKFTLPVYHQPALRVPQGGSCCANCGWYSPDGGRYGSCGQANYRLWAGTAAIPCPPDQWCSDWWESGAPLRPCR